MDSRLDNIFRTTFRTTSRQAESADTGMGIRREDPHDDHKRRKDDDRPRAEKPQWEDEASVSIAALKQFLSTLIAPNPQDNTLHDNAAQNTASQNTTRTPVPTQVNPAARQQRAHIAARAYQTTARQAHAHPPAPSPENALPSNATPSKATPYKATPSDTTPNTAPSVSNAPTLSAEENRLIHQLLIDLDILLQYGVAALTIQKEGSFLESLHRAARKARESHG